MVTVGFGCQKKKVKLLIRYAFCILKKNGTFHPILSPPPPPKNPRNAPSLSLPF